MSLKDKLNDNELDLSLSELTDVPVKELLAIPKATHVDLSRNRIKSLPSNFSTLTHIIKLDLSKNELTELPHNFGNLTNLQYLDLYGNKLTALPISFCRLKNLRWLDLKNNPLEAPLKTIAGDCLDQTQCQQCAKKVVAHMQSIESELEREKQKKLKEQREREAALKAEEQRALEEARKIKKAEREKRKAELREQRLRQQQQEKEQNNEKEDTSEKEDAELNGIIYNQQANKKSGSWISCLMTLILIPLAAVGAIIGYHVYIGNKVESYDDVFHILEDTWKIINKQTLIMIDVIKLHMLESKNVILTWTEELISSFYKDT
ncbi:leucine-rich repeat-containing protein 59-like [Centruroides vittatus]|uniref:leucine-rich repeat-containing protein 59-like n=1 Tax=Centruroides vittatus TaxID=120091 RepID=UPI00350F2E61